MDRNLQPIQFPVVSPVSWRIGKSAAIQMLRLHLPRTDEESPLNRIALAATSISSPVLLPLARRNWSGKFS